MTYTPIPDLKDSTTFSDDAIMTKKVYTYGAVSVYPPDAPAEEWPDRAWLLVTENDGEGNPPGLRVELKAEHVHKCFDKPYFITRSHHFA